jgi:Mg-chelatase subunit ChlD
MLYEADDLVKSSIRDAGADGGTDPTEALMYSQSVFANSKRAVKLLFTITDGEWGNAETADEIIARLGTSGVITSIAIIGDETSNTHNSTISAQISNPKDLVGLAKSIVKLSIQEALIK